jgi:peptide/nickel transport system substrate-binding protein
MKKKLSIILLITFFMSLLTACSDPTGTITKPEPGATPDGSGTSKTRLVTSDYFDPPPAIQGNPFAPSNIGGMGEYVFDRLFEYVPVPQDNFIPMLAERFETSGAKTTIYLKKDIQWNDGKPFTSKDVVCSYYMGYLAGWAMWRYANSVEAPDNSTVVINWKKPGAILSQLAFSNHINSPEHIYGKWAEQLKAFPPLRDEKNNLQKEDQDKLQAIREDLFKFKPDPKDVVGTGPYKVSNVTASEGILVKNPNYRDLPLIKIDEVRVQRYTSQEAYLSTVMSGGYDMEPHGLAPDVFKQIEAKNPNMKIIWTADLGQPSMQFNTAKYPMNIPQVRKAVMTAIDREALMSVVEPGTFAPDYYSTTMTPLFVDKFVPKDLLQMLQSYKYSAATAAEFLNEIGWKKGSDGFYRNEKGEVVNIELASMNSWPIFFLGGQAITDQLNKFGLKTTFKPMELSAYWQYLDNGESMMSFDFRGNCQSNGYPWDAFRNVFQDSGARIGIRTKVGDKPSSTAALEDVVLSTTDGKKTFKEGAGHVFVKTSDGREVNVTETIDKLLYAIDKDEQTKLIRELTIIANEMAVLMPLGEKYSPMKVYNENLTGYSLDKTAPENYGYGMRVISKMIKMGKLSSK